eukprot:m.188817 g.188817  ORF g.188817 m.188817 type:complete len:297 (+) comp17554_c0_seq1:133-1023(+)
MAAGAEAAYSAGAVGMTAPGQRLAQSVYAFALTETEWPQTHTAAVAYTATRPDEASLDVGDALYVDTTLSDGWAVGRNLTSGRLGTFPSKFIKRTAGAERERERVMASTHVPPSKGSGVDRRPRTVSEAAGTSSPSDGFLSTDFESIVAKLAGTETLPIAEAAGTGVVERVLATKRKKAAMVDFRVFACGVELVELGPVKTGSSLKRSFRSKSSTTVNPYALATAPRTRFNVDAIATCEFYPADPSKFVFVTIEDPIGAAAAGRPPMATARVFACDRSAASITMAVNRAIEGSMQA